MTSVKVIALLCAMLGVSMAAPFVGTQGSVTMTNGVAKFAKGLNKASAAYGAFDPYTNHVSGFGVLQIETNPLASDQDQYYAAGYLEGVLTASEIYDQHHNLLAVFSSLANGPNQNMTSFLKTQTAWVDANVKNNTQDPFWVQVGLIMAQYQGLQDGYDSVAPSNMSLDWFAFALLNGCGDMFDLIPKTDSTQKPNFEKMTTAEFKSYRQTTGHCSALVKLTDDFSQMYMSHSSWFNYQVTMRILKHYNFQAKNSVTKKLTFSSYAGFLESLDDFYLMDAGLVMLQTTNNVFTDLDKYIVPQSLLSWIRVRVACALATDGQSWSEYMSRHNSGTYNNQYMVVDLNKFTPGQPLPDGLLWVSEQIPGTFQYGDQTAILAKGYWPSYNVPFYENIYNMSGYPAMVEKHGTGQSYQLAPRAMIFRRDQSTVVDMDSFKAIMRYNNYLNDPLANGDPWAAICSRGDLASTNASPDGCYDTKVTNYDRALKMQSEVVNGPTVSHGLPPFSWTQYPNASRMGLPDTYNFQFEFMDPEWN
eukprot:m.199418 g.199418  ORF g.199418 m.199418 type:complete len:533 (-) comp14943_c0_seq1:2649-4247(-)